MSNIITVAGENGKKKKGGGTNAVLTLMKELADFQDKVATCIDSQDLSDRRAKLEAFYDKLDEMAEDLLQMAGEGIKSNRNRERTDNPEDRVGKLRDRLISLNDNNSLLLEIPKK
jgi:hypothetical protein